MCLFYLFLCKIIWNMCFARLLSPGIRPLWCNYIHTHTYIFVHTQTQRTNRLDGQKFLARTLLFLCCSCLKHMFNILLDLKTRQGRWIKEKKPKVERMNSLENKASGTYSTAGIECKESVLQTSKG